MAISAGDAVLVFAGDTTQLDQAWDKVNTDAQTKGKPAQDAADGIGKSFDQAGKTAVQAGNQVNSVWQRVALTTVENQKAQEQLRTATANAAKAGSDDVVAMLALAQAQQTAAVAAAELAAAQKAAAAATNEEVVSVREANATLALTGELTGVTIPRHIRTFISTMPGVGAALEAAFSVAAILVFLNVVNELIDKVAEWHERAETLREDQAKLADTYSQTSESIQRDIDEQKAKFISLTQGPIAGLDYALKNLGPQASGVFKAINGEIQTTQGVFEELSSRWNPFNLFEIAKKDLGEFQAELTEAKVKAEEQFPGDTMKAYDAMLEATRKKVDDLDGDILKLKTDTQGQILGGKGTSLGGPAGFLTDPAALEKEKTALKAFIKQIQDSQTAFTAWQKGEQAQRDKDARDQQQAIQTAQIDGQKATNLAGEKAQLEYFQTQFSQGKVGWTELLQQMKDYEEARFQTEKNAQTSMIALLEKDPTKNAAALKTAFAQLDQLEIEHSANNLKISAEDYNHGVQQQKNYFESIIALTKDGSAQRIAAEQQYAEYLKTALGTESQEYLGELNRIAAAQRAYNEQQTRFAQEVTKGQIALSKDAADASVQYYQYLVTTARASAVTLVEVQHDADEKNYRNSKAALEKQLSELGPEEISRRQEVTNQLDLINQQHNERERLYALQSVDSQEAYYQALGLHSAEMYQRQEQVAQQSYNAIAKSGKASYETILEAQIAVVQAELAFRTANGENVTALTNKLRALQNALHNVQIGLGQVRTQGSLTDTLFKTLGINVAATGSAMQNAAMLAAGAFSFMANAFAQGGVTASQAAIQMAEAVLKSIASYAFAKGTEELALGFAAMSPWGEAMYGPPGPHFISSALWFAVGAATDIGAGLIANATSKSSNASDAGSQATSTTQATGVAQGATQGQNAQRLGGGGLALSPMLAMIGDNKSGNGAGAEAVIPLENPEALGMIGGAIARYVLGAVRVSDNAAQGLLSTGSIASIGSSLDVEPTATRKSSAGGSLADPETADRIGAAIARHMPESGGDTYIAGLISDDTLIQVMKKMNRLVERNSVTLVASHAHRLVKKG